MGVYDHPFGPPGGGDIEPVPVPVELPASSAQAPAWAMAAQALDARDQLHLRTGLHLRVMTSPLLGLPITPFRVLRAPVDTDTLRDDVVWTDDSPLPRVLDVPFEVTPDRPAIGWLPPAADATCAWIDVKADVPVGEELKVAAMVSTTRGPRAVAARSSAPYQVWASAIEHVRVEGTATIEKASWLPSSLAADSVLKLTALPVAPPHPRYAALDEGVLLAAARVTRAAPQRRALYDTTGAPAPAAAPPLAVPLEVARVGVLAEGLHPELLRLVDEEVLDPWLLSTGNLIVDEIAGEIGTSTNNCLDAVLNGTIDHGIARWLGFLDNDILTVADDADIAARVVTAVFAPNWAELVSSGLVLTIPPDAVVADLAALQAKYPDFAALGDLEGTVDGPFLDLGVMAAYSVGRPLDLPPPPAVVSITDQPTRTSDVATGPTSAWLPRVPPAAARRTKLVVGDLVAGAALAFARDDLDGTGPLVLNEASEAAEFNQPLVAAVTVTESGTSAAQGAVGERDCPAGAVRYHVAQADWFGRWSDWAAVDLDAGVRPGPPVPAVRAWATQPEVPDGDGGGPLAGRITATIPVPAPAELPPGANLLRTLRFQVTDAANHTTTTDHAIGDPTAPPATLTVDLPAPALTPGTATTVTVSCHFTDTSFVRSSPSPDLRLTISDPRPPGQVVVDPSLRYTARPDVTGRASVELTWAAASPQDRFRVYQADETTLRARLAGDEREDTIDLLAALDAAPDAIARAAVWTEHGAVLPRSAFTLVTPEPLPRRGSTMRFEHAVSGSLRTLALYRVVAVSATNVEADFAGSPVVPYAVPNTLPPPQPQLTARILDPAATGGQEAVAELTVRVPRGSRRAVEYRLRRSRVSAADPLLMPVVTAGPLHPPEASGEAHAEIVLDAGPSTLEPEGVLRPWNTYTWRVEVRGGPEPGGGPTGAWSLPSMPAGAAVVPLDDPPAPRIRDIRRRGAATAVDVDVPASVRGGSLGSYAVELYRQLPGETERLHAVRDERQRPADGAPWTFPDDGSTGAPATGTTYRAVVVDPRGRRSAPSPTRSLP